jgi:N-acetylglucosamine malate deacetylase 2
VSACPHRCCEPRSAPADRRAMALQVPEPDTTAQQRTSGGRASRLGRFLPVWATVLVVVAHPDDEAFGLGAIISQMTGAGAAVHILCYTHGEASTLNENGADLDTEREAELRQASTELAAATVTLLGYPDSGLAAIPPPELAAHAVGLAARHRPDGVLVFDDTGVTGHPDHRVATRAAVLAALATGLPVLAWALPAVIAGRLHAETGQPFTGHPPDRLDLCIRVNRTRQHRAALAHASQISPSAVVWRRWKLQGDREHLRWLLPPSHT